jgi:hypothetical protein
MELRTKSFITKYTIGDNEYSSFVIAENADEAHRIIKSRGIGEEIEGINDVVAGLERFSGLPDSEFLVHLPRIAHQSCWVAWMALKSGQIDQDDILGDEGILHEIIHLIDPSTHTSENIQKSRALLARLENLPLGVFLNHYSHYA